MKANFALTLTFTGIRLLHRAAGGWRIVGDVALDTSDLDGALTTLRKTALELEPAGLRTKLVLPGTQIRYLTIDAAGLPPDRLRAAAAAALDGATPYAVDDLVFDLSPDGDKTHIAAVARETLAEAEAFALEHRFAPISIVATPEAEAFLGEPFFGPTEHAARILGPGEAVEPDGVAIVELGPQEWPEGPVVDVTDDAPVAEPAAVSLPPQEDDRAEDMEDVASEAAPTEREDRGPESLANPPGPEPTAQEPMHRSVGFASRRVSGPGNGPKLGAVTRRFDPASLVASQQPDPPRAAASDPATATPPKFEALPISQEVEEDIEDDVPDPPPAAIAAFLSRRHAKRTTDGARTPKDKAQKNLSRARMSDDVSSLPAGAGSPAWNSPEPAQQPGMAEAPAVAFAAKEESPEIQPVRVPRPRSERQRMTIFGARQPEPDGAVMVGTKPRFLGLILTAMLLIFLAGVAAWAAAFVDEGLARFFAPRQPKATVTAEERAAEPEPAAQGTEELRTAALDTELPPDAAAEVAPDLRAEPATTPEFDPAEAEAHYAVTGIWTIPPEVPAPPGLVALEDLYITSIDPANLSFDAVALTPEDTLRNDTAPLAPADPAPPGTDFDLDERSLVIPTPDGAMSPDGIVVYSGPPPAKPPQAPPRAEEEEAAPADAEAATVPELAGFRPRPRPNKLVENTERRQLGGLSRSELAGYRPRMRPETAKQAEEKDEAPTAQAVANSLRPSGRPGNFDRIVARAIERNQRVAKARQGDAQQVAAAAPRAAAPSVPSRTSVTKEATVRNAIRLNRINLMGVYGSASNRRALVRLSNGRYKKVKVGDRIDGGRVSAIGDSELSYVKGNRSILLKMPRT